MCGRIIGYQVGSPDGFNQYYRMISLKQGYMDGVSINYGYPCHHIWSYVAGAFETRSAPSNCPCSPAQGAEPQEFIGSNYYCESGYPSNTFTPLEVITSDGVENSVKVPLGHRNLYYQVSPMVQCTAPHQHN